MREITVNIDVTIFGKMIVISSYTYCFLIFLFTYFTKAAILDVPILTCEETLRSILVPLKMDCDFHLGVKDYIFICSIRHQSRRHVLWKVKTMFLVKPLYRTSLTSNNDFTQCIKWSYIKGKTINDESHYKFKFAKRMNVGVVIMKNGGALRDANTTFELKIRADVLALPQFSFTPDEPLFWNTSSPLYSAELGLLKSVKVTGRLGDHYPMALPGLSGSSVRHLFLNGSFGTDQKGHLPHLDHLPLLKRLIIIQSPRTDLTTDDLKKTKHITDLVIRQNQFREIPRVLKQFKKIKTFDFESTVQNFSLVPKTFYRVTSLESLHLSGTVIEHWSGQFPRLPCLTQLYLNSCKMKSFSAALTDFPQLEHLELMQNSLSFLEYNAFEGLPRLSEIYLSKNPLSFYNSQALMGIPLNTVQLNSCNLTAIPHLPSNYFRIIGLRSNLISNFRNLKYELCYVDLLDLSQNNITGWDDENIFAIERSCEGQLKLESETFLKNGSSYEPNAWVSNLNLSNNFISIFSSAMLQSFSFLEQVDLGGNSIDCGDCRSQVLQEWLGTTKITVLNLNESTRLTCFRPAHMRGQFVQEVDFDALCFTPRRRLWLGMALSVLGSVAAFAVIGGVIFYYRTEVAYLVHLAKIRSTSKKTVRNLSEASYDAFVCYSGKNRKWVLSKMCPSLERPPESYVLCLFDRDFRLGTHIVSNIVDAIEHSRKVIVVLTQHFIDSKWCQWELEMAQHKLFSEDREFLVLLELEPLERRRLPRLLRFLLDTRPVVRWPRPETAPAVMAAAAELRAVLGPSLRQTLLADPPTGDEPRPSSSSEDKLVLVANELGVANDANDQLPDLTDI